MGTSTGSPFPSTFWVSTTISVTPSATLLREWQSVPFADLGASTFIPHEAEKTAMGWPVEPEGLTEILVRIKKDYADLSIYVTENGRAVHDYIDPEGDVDDEERVSYLD